MGHVHAAAMAEYAKDAAETDKPWERWEFCHMRGEYQSLHSHPGWVEDNKYRRKPKVILINGHEVPEPLRTPLMTGDTYWTNTFYGVCGFSWDDSKEDNEALKAGFIHLTKEAAQKHYEALKSFTFKEDSNECIES